MQVKNDWFLSFDPTDRLQQQLVVMKESEDEVVKVAAQAFKDKPKSSEYHPLLKFARQLGL